MLVTIFICYELQFILCYVLQFVQYVTNLQCVYVTNSNLWPMLARWLTLARLRVRLTSLGYVGR